MGVFSLARRSPRIRSRVAGRPPRAVELGENHFVGGAAAAITDADDYRPAHGTEVTFSIPPEDTCWTVGHLSEGRPPLPAARLDRRQEARADGLPEGRRARRDVVGAPHRRVLVDQPLMGDAEHQLPRPPGDVSGPALGPRAAGGRLLRAENVVGDGRRRRLPGARADAAGAHRDHPDALRELVNEARGSIYRASATRRARPPTRRGYPSPSTRGN